MMEMHPHTQQAYELMHDGVLALARAERQGIRIDIKLARKQKRLLTKRIEKLDEKLKTSEFYEKWRKSSRKPINHNSNTQLRDYLYKKLGYKPIKTTKSGEGSTDEEALAALNIPEINYMLEARKLKKLRDTYLESFLREETDGYIHPSFHLHFVRTFRGSSSDPNFQNIPKRDEEGAKIIRDCLFPRPGNQLMEIDFGSIEVRIAAAYNKDPQLIHDIVEGDMHGDMAREIFKVPDFDKNKPEHSTLRKATKNSFVFPQFYGDYYVTCAHGLAITWGKLPDGKWQKKQGIKVDENTHLSDHLISKGLTSFKKFTDHIEKIEKHFWTKRYPVYTRWKEQVWQNYQDNGYIDMFTGFRCKGIFAKNKALNYPIQGAAFHCLLWSLTTLDTFMTAQGYKSRIIGQIHDAIVFDVVPEEREQLILLAENVMTRSLPKEWPWLNIVPLEVETDIGEKDGSWSSLKKHQKS